MMDVEPWYLTVVRTQGLRLMRHEKAWRPIVTVEVDKQHTHETLLGTDGQNPNLKETFRISDATHSSKLELKIWHRGQSKKKKKRNLVASACHSLGELMKKMELDTEVDKNGHITRPKAKYLDIKLTCQSPTNRASTPSSRGRPQNGALLTLKLYPPPPSQPREAPKVAPCPNEEAEIVPQSEHEHYDAYGSDSDGSSSSSRASNTLIDVRPPTPVTVPHSPPGLIKRRKTKKFRGYNIDTDEDQGIYSSGDDSSSSCSSSSPLVKPTDHEHLRNPHLFEEPTRTVPLDFAFDSYSDCEDDIVNEASATKFSGTLSFASNPVTEWIAASLLPQYTERIEVVEPEDSRMRWWESFLASFTVYESLREARMDSDFESVFRRLQMEWTYVGGLLVALAAVNTAVFSISPDSSFSLTSLSRSAIAASSIFSGMGLSTTAYFILRYSFSPLPLFKSRALDVYSSYVFFSLSSRVPTLCMVGSALCLMGFLGLVAFEAWPLGVVCVFFGVGVVMALQFLVYGVHLVGKGIVGGGRRVVGVGRGVVRRVSGMNGVGVNVREKVDRKVAGGC